MTLRSKPSPQNELERSLRRKRVIRWMTTVLWILGCYAAYFTFSWLFVTHELNQARAQGVYDNPEQGLQELVDKDYAPDHTMKIYYAGPNEDNRTKPYVWYVIAEVHASARADGSALGRNGCDNPGVFFIQLKDGRWVHVPEGILTTFMLEWPDRFDLVGEGQSAPSTDLLHDRPAQFCR